jgi:hypothetical protein
MYSTQHIWAGTDWTLEAVGLIDFGQLLWSQSYLTEVGRRELPWYVSNGNCFTQHADRDATSIGSQ